MKKIFFFVALFAAVSMNAQDKVVKVMSDLANYIDFQALSVSDPNMTTSTITSTQSYTLPNGTVLLGHLNVPAEGEPTEAKVEWNVKTSYNTTMPTPAWENVDSLKAGTMFRAGSGVTMTLGAFKTTADGKLTVYFQPNGDSERGVSVSIFGNEVAQLTGSGKKIDGIRPAYAGSIDLEAGNYEAGDIVIKLIVNASNIFGVSIDNLSTTDIINPEVAEKAQKMMLNGQMVIFKGGKYYNALGAEMK